MHKCEGKSQFSEQLTVFKEVIRVTIKSDQKTSLVACVSSRVKMCPRHEIRDCQQVEISIGVTTMSKVGLLALTLACGVFISAQSAEHKRPPASSASDVRLSSAIKLVRPSIVQILRRFETSPAEREALHLQSDSLVLGTGFIVDVKNGYVVTALHVVRSGEQPIVLPNGQPWHPQRDDLRIGIAMPNIKLNSMTFQESFVGVGYTIVARDERHDLALLKATGQIENIFYIKTPTQDVRGIRKRLSSTWAL